MKELEEIMQLYSALSLCNQAIDKIQDEKELFTLVCEKMLGVSHIKMSWIGLLNEEGTTLEAFSYCGDGTEYVQKISIDLTNEKFNNGPSAIALKTNQAYWCEDYLNDPKTLPWRHLALEFGWNSSAAIPVHKKGKIIGTLNLYSTRLNAFTETSQDLILKMVNSLDTALANIENNRAKETAEQAVQDSFNLLSTVINAFPTRVFWKDKNLAYLGCNTPFAQDAGKTSPEEIIGKTDFELPWKEQAELYNKDDRSIMDSKMPKLFFEEPQTTPNGDTIWLRTSKVPLKNSQGEIIGILGMYDDITEQKKLENELKQSNEKLYAIFEHEPACVKLLNLYGEVLDMNPAGLEMLELASVDTFKTQPLIEFVVPKWRDKFIELHKEVLQGKSGTLTFEMQSKKGTKRWVQTHAVPMRDDDGNINMVLGLTNDITEQKASEERILFMANYDSLTQLPNRANIESKIEYNIALSQRNKWNFSIIFLDIDNFKDINDTLGHEIGDKLLIAFSKRIKEMLRNEDTLARLGGDEFILLLPHTEAQSAQEVVKKLLTTIYQPFMIEQHKLTITSSIGISVYPDDGTDVETLYRNADTAMYRAKNSGKNDYSFFTPDMQEAAQRNLKLSNAMHDAIENNEFSLVFQPQFSSVNDTLIGVETLLRWTHPEFGPVSPNIFIPLAESNGLILKIGQWVMENAVAQLSKWFEQGLEPISVSINLSAVQFNQPDLCRDIKRILDTYNFPAKYIDLELTESAVMHNPQMTINTIERFHRLGVQISIDDFGTGYSSLSYLKKFKVHKLKIDQSFVRDITTDPDDKAIVKAIINLAKSLNLQTIAEGVETIEQLHYLKSFGCDEIQGFYFAKPLRVAEFEERYLLKK